VKSPACCMRFPVVKQLYFSCFFYFLLAEIPSSW